MHKLRILKIDANPIEWPPPSISTFVPPAPDTIGEDNTEEMAMWVWLREVQGWIRREVESVEIDAGSKTRGFVEPMTR